MTDKKRKTIRKIDEDNYWVEDHGFCDREEMEHISKYLDWRDVNWEDVSIQKLNRKKKFQYYLQQELMKVKIEKMKAAGTWKADTVITPENLLDID